MKIEGSAAQRKSSEVSCAEYYFRHAD
jgi:hypothetical protein